MIWASIKTIRCSLSFLKKMARKFHCYRIVCVYDIDTTKLGGMVDSVGPLAYDCEHGGGGIFNGGPRVEIMVRTDSGVRCVKASGVNHVWWRH